MNDARRAGNESLNATAAGEHENHPPCLALAALFWDCGAPPRVPPGRCPRVPSLRRSPHIPRGRVLCVPPSRHLFAHPSRPLSVRPVTASLSAHPPRPRPVRPALPSPLRTSLAAAVRASRHCVALRTSIAAASRASRHHLALRSSIGCVMRVPPRRRSPHIPLVRVPCVPSPHRSSQHSRPCPLRSSSTSLCAFQAAASRVLSRRVLREGAQRDEDQAGARRRAV